MIAFKVGAGIAREVSGTMAIDVGTGMCLFGRLDDSIIELIDHIGIEMRN